MSGRHRLARRPDERRLAGQIEQRCAGGDKALVVQPLDKAVRYSPVAGRQQLVVAGTGAVQPAATLFLPVQP